MLQFLVVLIFSLSIFTFVEVSKARSAAPEIIFTNSSTLIANINPELSFTEYKEPIKPRDPRAIKLEKYLRSQSSSLSRTSDLIIDLSDKYKIDYKLVIAIAGLESGYCDLAYNGYNCWGFGNFYWATPEIAVKEYFRLMKINYFNKGLNTIQKIAPVYAPISTDYLRKYYIHYNQIP